MRGSIYVLGEGVEVNGIDKLTAHIRQHPEMVAEVRERMMAKLADGLAEDADDPTLDAVAAAAAGE
jgi:hypothetical protein